MHALTVTDSIMALDELTDEALASTQAIGAESELGFGQLFTLVNDDVLSGIQMGWAGSDAKTCPVRIYKTDGKSRGDLVLDYQIEKPEGKGMMVHALPAISLPAGKYLVYVFASGYVFATDHTDAGKIYVVSGNQYVIQTGLGNPCLRLVLDAEEPVSNDVSIQSINKPSAKGAFLAHQPVEVRVVNMGNNQVTTNVLLKVDGKQADQTSVTLDAYEYQVVTLHADLDKVGSHTLEVTAVLDGDVNPANNTLTKTVETVEGVSPYVLDFESCEDFSISELNPQWTMVDNDNQATYTLNGITFPNQGSKMAYIVFNASALSGLTEAQANGFAAHGGNKFGGSFCSQSGKNDDWLISPQLTMADKDSDPKLTFWAKSYSSQYGLETFKVLVSETDNNLSSFKEVLGNTEAPAAWTEYTVSLADYAGKNVYVAIQCTSPDRLLFMVDDIAITNPATTGINTVSTTKSVKNVSYYNVAGQASNKAFSGMNVVVTTYSDGTQSVAKRIVKLSGLL